MQKLKLFLLAVFLALPLHSFAADGDLVSVTRSGVYDIEYRKLCSAKVAADEGLSCCVAGASPCTADGFNIDALARGQGAQYAVFIDAVDGTCAANVTATVNLKNRISGRNHVLSQVLTNTGVDTYFYGPSLPYINVVLTNLTSCAGTGVDVGLFIYRPRN